MPDEIDLPDEVLLAMWEEAKQGEPVEVIDAPVTQVRSRWLKARSQTSRLGYSIHASQSTTSLVMRPLVDQTQDSPERSPAQRP